MKKILVLLVGCLVLGACADNHGAKTEAGKTFIKFANAKTIKEKSKYILEPEKMLPYMKDYYKNSSDIRLRDYNIIQEKDNGKFITLKIKQGEYLYWALAKKEKDGKYKIDWQFYTCYTPQTLGEFINNEENNKKFKIYGSIDRSIPPFLSNIVREYYTFRIIRANIGQGVLNEKDDGYAVQEAVIGLCSKKKKECKEFYNILAKRNINSACAATLQLEKAPKDYVNPYISFALVTDIEPSWYCKIQ